jgi:hypothetical protein
MQQRGYPDVRADLETDVFAHRKPLAFAHNRSTVQVTHHRLANEPTIECSHENRFADGGSNDSTDGGFRVLDGWW